MTYNSFKEWEDERITAEEREKIDNEELIIMRNWKLEMIKNGDYPITDENSV